MNQWIMIFASICAGLAATMNTWADRWSDIHSHLNDVYMIILMTSIMMMIAIMMEPMDHEHQDIIPIWGYVFVAIVMFFFIRQQTFITDSQYLRGMIPHHSMAITMSERIAEKT